MDIVEKTVTTLRQFAELGIAPPCGQLPASEVGHNSSPGVSKVEGMLFRSLVESCFAARIVSRFFLKTKKLPAIVCRNQMLPCLPLFDVFVSLATTEPPPSSRSAATEEPPRGPSDSELSDTALQAEIKRIMEHGSADKT